MTEITQTYAILLTKTVLKPYPVYSEALDYCNAVLDYCNAVLRAMYSHVYNTSIPTCVKYTHAINTKLKNNHISYNKSSYYGCNYISHRKALENPMYMGCGHRSPGITFCTN